MAPRKQGLRLIVSFAKWRQIVPGRLELVVLITEQWHLFIRVFHHHIGSLFQCVNNIDGSHFPELWMNWKSPGNVNYTLKICEARNTRAAWSNFSLHWEAPNVVSINLPSMLLPGFYDLGLDPCALFFNRWSPGLQNCHFFYSFQFNMINLKQYYGTSH